VEKYNIYQQIAERTQGDIYIGVVGPGENRKVHIHKKIYGLVGYTEYRK